MKSILILLLASTPVLAQTEPSNSTEQIKAVLNNSQVLSALPGDSAIQAIIRSAKNVVTVITEGCTLQARVTDFTPGQGVQVAVGPLNCGQPAASPTPSPSP